MSTPYRQPDYLLTLGGLDITPRVGSRLVSLQLDESRGDEADQLELCLDDADGRLALPPLGGELQLQLGWRGEGLVDKGTFVVDEVEHLGAPDQITLRARAAELRSSLRQRGQYSWDKSTVGRVVAEVAARSGLRAKVHPQLAEQALKHIDQTNESDIHFLTRLARLHDAVCTVKKSTLVFMPINSAHSASGQALDELTITRAAGDQHRWHMADRTAYTGVKAQYYNYREARVNEVRTGDPRREKRLKDRYGSKPEAARAVQSEMQRIDRGKATLEITLALGRPELMPQSPVTVHGFKPEIDGTDWRIVKVSHSINEGSGFTTRLELEIAGQDVSVEGGDDTDDQIKEWS